MLKRLFAWLDKREDDTIIALLISCMGIALTCMILWMMFHKVVCGVCS